MRNIVKKHLLKTRDCYTARFPLGIVLALFGIQYIAWSASSSMVRLLIPAPPLFCLYAADSLDALGKKWRGWAPWAAIPMVVWTISWNAAIINQLNFLSPVFGYETREAFLDRKHHGYHNPYREIISASPGEISRSLIRLGVSHILINHGEAHRLMKPKLHRLGKEKLRTLTRFLHSWTDLVADTGRAVQS